MEFKELPIAGAWLVQSPIHRDARGSFREWFRSDEFKMRTGLDFNVIQSNISISNQGVIRGIHYSLAKQGQAKWITCASGAIWDVVVDIRPSSPTFKHHVGIDLSGDSGDMLCISEGLGHGFVSLRDQTVVSYLLTSPYSPDEEFGIDPFDQDLAISWPLNNHSLSSQDKDSPSLIDQLIKGLLPDLA
jgi:dTDP-4-dehydrorhamnose 3,5-epimerase